MPSAKSSRSKTTLQSSKTSKRREKSGFCESREAKIQAGFSPGSTLARLEAALNLVDDVNPALAADQTVVAVTTTQRFQRVTDLHGTILVL
jgi:hypothetical protein